MSEETLVDACTYAELHLQEFFDRVLTPSQASVIELHLVQCSHCARAYAFEQRFRAYVKNCCGGGGSEERCREEFRQALAERCRQTRP